jgi:hypothetical protein
MTQKNYCKGMLIMVLIVVLAVSGCVQTFNSDAECDLACKEIGYDRGACMPNPPNGTLYPVIGECNASICQDIAEEYTCVCICFNNTSSGK